MNPFFKVLLSLEACACLIFPRAADADGTNRIGVLTVSYVMTSDGSGEWYWYSPGIYGFSGDDSIQLSIAGKVQYAVMQSETNLFIGEVISATQQQSAAGSDNTQSWDPPPTTDGTDTFTSDPSFIQTNVCVTLTNTTAGTNLFLGVCEKVSFGASQGGVFYTWDKVWQPDDVAWPPFYDVGTMCAIQGMDNVRLFQFTLTNSALPWTQTLTTNSAVSTAYSDGDGSATGSSSAARTVVLQFAPDQLTFEYDATPTNGTAPLTVTFTAPKTNSSGSRFLSARWDFGDGGTDTSHFKIAHCYTNAGDFTVGVVFTNEEGQAYTGIGPQLVHVVPLTFTASPTNGPTPLTVQFSCPTAEHGASDVTEWQWDFGDGTGSEAQNPTHTYSEVNNYEVSLTVANEDDISTEGSGPATIAVEAPTVLFAASPAIGAEPLPVLFICPSEDNTGSRLTSWSWNFGDGGTSTAQNPAHIYLSGGQFSPTLSAINSRGDTVEGSGPLLTVASRSGLVINGDFETGNLFAWTDDPMSFDNVSGDSRYAHAGDYGLELAQDMGTSSYLSQALATAPGTTYLLSFWLDSIAGIADFSASWGDTPIWSATNIPAVGWTNVQVITTATTTNTLLKFTFGGMDPLGLDDVDVENVFVQFTATPAGGAAPLPVNFACPSVDDNGHALTGWNWHFGDGSTSASQNPSHLYTLGGTFTVGLIATNSQGGTVIGFGPAITVSVPDIQFTASPTTGGVPLSVQFNCPNKDSASNALTSWFWSFGDGSTSLSQNPVHIYGSPGSFTPTLLATNSQAVQVSATGPTVTAAACVGLVVNGGFETGNFTGWSTGGNFTWCDVDGASDVARSGNFGAYLGAMGHLGYLYQTLVTTPGAAYRISFWLDNPTFDPPNEFVVSWNGTTLLDWSNAPAFAWTNIQFNVTAPGSSALLQFGFKNYGDFGLDQIAVLPGVMSPPSLGRVCWSGRNLVMNTVAGLGGATYHLLTSTNLALPNSQWTPVATYSPDANGAFTIVVTNAFDPLIAGRFYILKTP